ncbi:hypothetical protein IAD21_03793 [Abditibacteriota bacterium]|nr:hypothetical protein IAD21_03793 [Abditibacteriota bacterium]
MYGVGCVMDQCTMRKLTCFFIASIQFNGFPKGINFSPDGEYLFVESWEWKNTPRAGMMSVFNTHVLDYINTYSIEDQIPYGFTVNPTGGNIATFSCEGLTVRDMITGNVISKTDRTDFECACYSPDGKKIVLSSGDEALFTFIIESGTLIKGTDHPQTATTICPVSEDTFLIATVAQEGSMFWFARMDERGVMQGIEGMEKWFDEIGLTVSFDIQSNRICAVSDIAHIFGYPNGERQAIFDSGGDFVWYGEEIIPSSRRERYDWSNPVFLGSSGVVACESPEGLLFLDLDSQQRIGIFEGHSVGRRYLAYHAGKKLLASVGGDGVCIVRRVDVEDVGD